MMRLFDERRTLALADTGLVRKYQITDEKLPINPSLVPKP